MRFFKIILCGFLMVGAVGNVCAQVPEPEVVNIRFTLCLLPINKSAYMRLEGEGVGGITTYTPPTLSYHNGSKRVDFDIVHGQSKKELTYRGAPVLNFYKKGESGGAMPPVGSVEINPAWKDVLLFAVSGTNGAGEFKMLAMNLDGLRLEPGDLYAYNLTSEILLSTVGNAELRLEPEVLQRVECDLSAKRLQPVIVSVQRDDELKQLFGSKIAFSRLTSNLLLIYYEKQNPDRLRVKLVRDVSL